MAVEFERRLDRTPASAACRRGGGAMRYALAPTGVYREGGSIGAVVTMRDHLKASVVFLTSPRTRPPRQERTLIGKWRLAE
jgi:hypothetical protein